ncbi:MAG: 23S rRNA (uracil(1939)-C(5))-methyltransferase RlmD [FCB group bacterium]|nr:23S rRNA (uracil(1939)-C(5))-methyltransferase RlmD [FCB group bacterium]
MSNPELLPLRKGTEHTVKIESLAYGGRGIGRVQDFVIFVDRALPGQTVKILLYRKRKGFGEGRILEVLKESAFVETPVCEHFGLCGGCKLQHLQYTAQLEQKRLQVEDSFRRIGGLPNFKVTDTIPADPIYAYRNKMEFTLSNRRWVTADEPEDVPRNFALGLHIPGRFDKVLDIHSCHLQPEIGNTILRVVREIALENGLKAYDPKTHIGFLRHLVIRYGHRTQEIMVNLVTSYENLELLEPLITGLKTQVPEVTSIVNNINTRKGDTAYGEWEILLHGEPFIREMIGELTFHISANSFFQTNSLQAERLYETVRTAARLTGSEIVYDLYCGAGTIGLYLARDAREVIGLEIAPFSVDNARTNAELNGIKNAQFIRANLDTYFGSPRKIGPPPDVVVVDPPRVGMHADMVKALVKLSPGRMVYVSCNPTTLARDAQGLMSAGYDLTQATLVDMFPHTAHIETVAEFVKS